MIRRRHLERTRRAIDRGVSEPLARELDDKTVERLGWSIAWRSVFHPLGLTSNLVSLVLGLAATLALFAYAARHPGMSSFWFTAGPILAFAAPSLVALLLSYRRVRTSSIRRALRAHGLPVCPRCGYVMRELDRCPECGWG